MYLDQFTYTLVVRNIEPEEAAVLMDMMKQEKYFDGALTPDYSPEDVREKRIFFDCGNAGSISKIQRQEVEETMHVLAMAFPSAKFYLDAENLDNAKEQYQICTYKDMYQSSDLQFHMPKLSTPVPFSQRSFTQASIGETNYLEDFFHKTDFDLLYAQKQALLQARDGKAALSSETIDGLVNFLDFIGDWAENEGHFTYPAFDKEDILDSIMNFIKKELPEAGKISYPLSDGVSFLNISIENNNADKEIYSVMLYQPKGLGFINTCSCNAELNETSLRKACDLCLDYYEEEITPKKPGLDSIISAASKRSAAPPSSQRDPSKENDR